MESNTLTFISLHSREEDWKMIWSFVFWVHRENMQKENNTEQTHNLLCL